MFVRSLPRHTRCWPLELHRLGRGPCGQYRGRGNQFQVSSPVDPVLILENVPPLVVAFSIHIMYMINILGVPHIATRFKTSQTILAGISPREIVTLTFSLHWCTSLPLWSAHSPGYWFPNFRLLAAVASRRRGHTKTVSTTVANRIRAAVPSVAVASLPPDSS